MNKKYGVVLSAVLPLAFLVVWGCQGNKALAPARPFSLNVSLAQNKDLTASLLGSSLNDILYCVRGGATTLTGSTGPFVSSGNTGTVDFSITMTEGPNQVLALQLNDATTGLPLAIGAVALNLEGSSASSSVTVELGSVISDCYQVNTVPIGGEAFNFNTDDLNTICSIVGGVTLTFDESIEPDPTYGGFQFADAAVNPSNCQLLDNNSIAYMGNGNLVNYAYVPPSSDFFSTSSAAKIHVIGAVATPTPPPLPSFTKSAAKSAHGKAVGPPAPSPDFQVGDVYCIALGSIPGGHAWVQISTLGNAGETAPAFIFRANNSLPYYGYFQTEAGASGNCITPPPVVVEDGGDD